jgi:hypothetical protein
VATLRFGSLIGSVHRISQPMLHEGIVREA